MMLGSRVLRRLSLGCGILSCCCAAPCFSADNFIRKELRVPGRVQSVTIGDFNGDSRPDIAIRTVDDLSILLNAGGGEFSPPIRTALRYGFALSGVTDYGVGRAEIAADFNGDGRLDLAIRDRNEILFGVDDGTFLPPQAISGEFPSFYGLTATGDFNADQKSDLVSFVRGSLGILLGNGDGTFRMGSTAELGGNGQLVLADLNRDGRSDLVYLRYRYHSSNWDPNCCDLRIFLGQGDGTFLETVPISGIVAGGILVADFNEDGIPDIATVNVVLLGNGDGSFQNSPRVLPGSVEEEDKKIFYSTPSGPFAATDLDGDSHVELVEFESNNTEGRQAGAIRGRGDGTFFPCCLFPNSSFGFHAWEAADRRVGGVADLDGDGRPDVVTAVYCPLAPEAIGSPSHYYLLPCTDRSNNLSIFLNRIEVQPR